MRRRRQDGLARAETFIQSFLHDPLITPAVAPHSAYTLDKSMLLACRDLALKYKVPLITHLAETEDEVRIIRDAVGADADRLSRVDWLLGAADDRRTRCVGQ